MEQILLDAHSEHCLCRQCHAVKFADALSYIRAQRFQLYWPVRIHVLSTKAYFPWSVCLEHIRCRFCLCETRAEQAPAAFEKTLHTICIAHVSIGADCRADNNR